MKKEFYNVYTFDTLHEGVKDMLIEDYMDYESVSIFYEIDHSISHMAEEIGFNECEFNFSNHGLDSFVEEATIDPLLTYRISLTKEERQIAEKYKYNFSIKRSEIDFSGTYSNKKEERRVVDKIINRIKEEIRFLSSECENMIEEMNPTVKEAIQNLSNSYYTNDGRELFNVFDSVLFKNIH